MDAVDWYDCLGCIGAAVDAYGSAGWERVAPTGLYVSYIDVIEGAAGAGLEKFSKPLILPERMERRDCSELSVDPVPEPEPEPEERLPVEGGRVDPNNTAWLDSRKPLAAQWKTAHGQTLFTVNLHLVSKGGSSTGQVLIFFT